MDTGKIHNINLKITPSTIRDYLPSCIKTIISRRGICPTSACIPEDRRGEKDINVDQYIEAVVSHVEDFIKDKKKIWVVVAILTQDFKLVENWFIDIEERSTTAATIVPTVNDYLNQIILATGPNANVNPCYRFNVTTCVYYPTM